MRMGTLLLTALDPINSQLGTVGTILSTYPLQVNMKCLFTCLFVCLFVVQFTCLFVCLFVVQFTCLFVCLFVYFSFLRGHLDL